LLAPCAARAFDCADTKCNQIKSCEEAHHKLTVCGHSERDGDNDGIPCEMLCGDNLESYLKRVGAWTGKVPPAAKKPPAAEADAGADPSLNLTGADGAIAEDDRAESDEFKCSGKRTCKQMASCDEAKFYLSKCGVKSLDGDRDGVPCNRLCK
jgi:hypothetical protein